MQTLENSVRLGYTHTSVGGRLKWVAGQTGCSIGGERQSSSVHRVSNTGRDRNLFVYHSFDLRGDEANSPRIVKLRLDREYLFDEASLDEQIICSAESCQSPSLHEVVLEFLFFLFFSFSFFYYCFPFRIESHIIPSSHRCEKECCSFQSSAPFQIIIYIDRIQIVPDPVRNKQYPAELSNRDKARRRSFNRRSKLPGSRSITGPVVVICRIVARRMKNE